MAGLSAGKAIGYATLPGVFPRIRELFFSGFGNIAYFIALTYAMVRLLPAHHPYLNPANTGKFGVRHVIAAAMHELRFSWKNIDQILVFFAILAGAAGLMMFIVGLIAFIIVSPVYAMAYFVTQAPEQDIAFMMLDKAFGLPGMFMSEVETNPGKYGPFPNNFHVGMRSLFQFFSMGLFLLSVFVFLYYIVVIVSETAVTGTPFGHRFDNVWIPIRILAALALLMPGFGGYNSAQYLVLYAAKWGSGLATNAWISYNLYSGNNPLGITNQQLITRPAMPDYTKLIKDLILIRGCMETYVQGGTAALPMNAIEGQWGVTEYMVKGSRYESLLPVPGGAYPNLPTGTYPNVPPRSPVVAVSVGGSNWFPSYDNMTTFQNALNFYQGGDIRIVFGTRSETDYPNEEGFVYPHCGELIIPVTGQTREALYVAEGYMAAVVRVLYSVRRSTAGGALDNHELALSLASARDYYQTSASWKTYTKNFFGMDTDCYWDGNNDGTEEFPRGGTALPILGNCQAPVPAAYWTTLIDRYQRAFEWGALAGYDYLTGAVTGEDMEYSIGDTYFQTLGDVDPMLQELGTLRYGWGGAGMWFNKIAERNGSLASAIGAAPYVIKYPAVMEKLKQSRVKTDKNVDATKCEIYSPRKAGQTSTEPPDERGKFSTESALSLYTLCVAIHENAAIRPAIARSTKSPSMVMNIINALFGASTFFNLLDNRDVHPMSMLTTLGRTLVDKAIFNLTAAAGTSVIGGITQLGPGQNEAGFAYVTLAAHFFTDAFVTFGSIALVAGVTLYYVLPMMPFMYFFFAVGRWVKTIFEAMVGVPLWALAHLSLKGPGLPSPAASGGYFLLLEIFIRPILTVFSLIAAFATFSAMVVALNTTFDLVISNIFGSDVKLIAAGTSADLVSMRGLIDQFFMTIIYVIIVYMIATSCFKLIDIIPDNIMRWSGAGAKSWGASDNADELVGNVDQYMGLITRTGVNQLGAGLVGISKEFADDAAQTIRAAEAAKAKKGGGGGGGGSGSPSPSTPSPTPGPTPGAAPAAPAAAPGTGGRVPATPGSPASPAASPLVPGATPAPTTGTPARSPGTGAPAAVPGAAAPGTGGPRPSQGVPAPGTGGPRPTTTPPGGTPPSGTPPKKT